MLFRSAFDLDGQLWATTGGGTLLQLDPVTYAVLGSYGESLTQALAVDPASGLLFVSSGDGIEIFDPATHAFTHFSNYRVDDLAFSPSGKLWGTSWPDRGTVVSFDNRGRAAAELAFDDAVDSLAFGKAGTSSAGLLFLSTQPRPGVAGGANLIMVDLATRQRLNVASGGPLAEDLVFTAEGRLLVANSQQVDVVMPVTPPNIIAVTPADGLIVPLPQNTVRIVFDQDMNVAAGARPESVLNPANYTLVGTNGGVVPVTSVAWDSATRTVTLGFDPLRPDYYELTVKARVQSADGQALRGNYVTHFVGIQDFSSLVRLDFRDTRTDRASGTLSFDIDVTNITDYNLQTPLMLVLDPSRFFKGSALGADTSGDGLWLLDIGSDLVNGVLEPGQSTLARTVTLTNAGSQRADIGYGLYAVPYSNELPTIVSTPVTGARAGEVYSYTVQALDPDGIRLSYVLLDGPEGMSLDLVSGLLTWTPTTSDQSSTSVTLRAYDSRGGYDTQTFAISVVDGNHAPTLQPLPDRKSTRLNSSH